MNNPRRTARLLATTILSFFVASCASPRLQVPISSYRSQSLEMVELKRVLVLPLVAEDQFPAEEEMVQQTFVAELKKASWFEVIHRPHDEALIRISKESFRRNAITIKELISLRQRFDIDAVCVISLSDYNPYPPQRLSLKAHLFSAETGEILWAADAMFDLRDEVGRLVVKNYFEKNANRYDSIFDWEICTVSPSRFAQCGCHSVVSTIEGKRTAFP